MKRLVIALLLLCLPRLAHAQALVDYLACPGGNHCTWTTNQYNNFLADTTAPNTVVLPAYTFSGSNCAHLSIGTVNTTTGAYQATSVTDTQNNTWHVKNSSPSTTYAQQWLAVVKSGADTITINFAPLLAGHASAAVVLAEFSGEACQQDVRKSASGSSVSPTTGTTGATSQANELVSSVIAISGAAPGVSPSSGTLIAAPAYTTNRKISLPVTYQIVSSIGAQSVTYTSGLASSTSYGGAIQTDFQTAQPQPTPCAGGNDCSAIDPAGIAAIPTATPTPSGCSGTLSTITVSPASATIGIGANQAFSATGTYVSPSCTQDVTAIATWSSSNTAVATVASGTALGVATGGPVTITAQISSVSGTSSLTVTGGTPTPTSTPTPTVPYAYLPFASPASCTGTLGSINVTPVTACIPLNQRQSFHATAYYVSPTCTQDVTLQAQWTSSDPSKVAMTGPSALGVAFGAGITVTATFDGESDTAIVDVTGP